MKIAYLHGLESSINEKDPKIIFMRANFKEVYAPSINYRDEKTFDKLFSDIKRLKPDLIIGSSMGGYVSYLIGSKLGIETILFNPAVEDRSFDPVVDESGMKKSKHNVYLGKSDNVVSGKAVRNYFKKHAIGSFTYTEYEGGHRVPEDEFMGSIEQITKIYKENIDNPKVMKRIKLYEEFLNEKYQVNEAKKAVNSKQKGIGKFLGSVKNTDVYLYQIYPRFLASSSEFKEMSIDDIDAMKSLVYSEFEAMHTTKLNGKPGKLTRQHLSNLSFLKSKKDGSFDKPAKKQEFGGNFDRMVKTSTKDKLLKNFN